jgi:hypothetical protein
MKRSTSSQSHPSLSSIPSAPPPSRRHPKQPTRSIAPKATQTIEPTGAPDMIRVKSSDGTSKSYGVLSRKIGTAPAKSPSPSKIRCNFCNEVPHGFRGEHELQRHTNLRHTRTRKVWICTDASENGQFLSKCKSCREKKEYGAYYNAAAHLRRIHFQPRKRGRKSKKDSEKRGGKAGGDWPAMEVLKASWMREIEVLNTDAPAVMSDTSSSADAEEAEDMAALHSDAGAQWDTAAGRAYPAEYFGEEQGRGMYAESLVYPDWRQAGMWSA